MNPSVSSQPTTAPRVDPTADWFTVLGLPRRYDLDRDEIERRYLELAAAVHPDRVSGGNAAERRTAMEASAAVNEAYRTLRDPVGRAEYLVKLGGIDLDSSDPRTGAPKMDQAFLVEMIERREALDEARSKGSGAVDKVIEQIENELDEVLDAAITALSSGALSSGALSSEDVRTAAQALVRRRYLERYLDEAQADDEPGL